MPGERTRSSRGERGLPPRAPDEPGADQDHGDGIDDAWREDADIHRVPGMRLARELLNDAAEDAVEDEEQAEHGAGPLERVIAVGGDAQDDPQHDALEKSLVELARVAR